MTLGELMERNKEIGYEAGREAGLSEGRELGARENSEINAFKMKKKGFTPEDISECTGLSIEEVEAL